MTLSLLASCGSPIPPPTSQALANELVFYDWADDMPQPVLDAFTQEYGIKVKYLAYSSSEEAVASLRAGQEYDVVVMDNRFIPLLVQEGLLSELDYHIIPNFKNISANFRDLIYDPANRHSIPFNWGTTGLVVRTDMVAAPVTRWADLWDPRYAGRVGIWAGQWRDMIALTLKSLGYSANSKNPAELEAALGRLLELKPRVITLEDYDPISSADVMASGKVVISMGYALDVLQGREKNPAVTYVFPSEGALMWGDNFIIPANSPRKYTAELFLNFLLRPEISAEITNENLYATGNEAANPFINTDILNDPVIFPPATALQNAEIILPLSPQEQTLYDDIWSRFMAEGQ